MGALRVLGIMADQGGCGNYRVKHPLLKVGAADLGLEVTLDEGKDTHVEIRVDDGAVQAVTHLGVPVHEKFDVVHLQRVASRRGINTIDYLQRRGVAVTVDYDDALWCIPPDNAAYAAYNLLGGATHWRFAVTVASLADWVTTSTEALHRVYARHLRGSVIRNTIPAEFVYPAKQGVPMTIGWSGWLSTHPRDLDKVGEYVRDSGLRLCVVGDYAAVARKWQMEAGGVGSQTYGHDYFKALRKIDIAVVPLHDSAFNRAKSWLKAMEFSAAGCRVVAQDTFEMRQLAKLIPSVTLVNDKREWRNRIADHAAEAELVCEFPVELTTQAYTHRWAKAWRSAYERRQTLRKGKRL